MAPTIAIGPTARDELRDFLRFVAHPRVAPRPPGRRGGNGWWEDWFARVDLRRLLLWACLLWAINLVFLGPLALAAAQAGGAVHRLNLDRIPWLQALLWAPVVEELLFRYSLRQIGRAWWLLPAFGCALLVGPRWYTLALVGLALLICWWPYLRQPPSAIPAVPWRWRAAYLRSFPWVLHGACLLFAAVHLNNFSLHQMPWWLMPVLVLPQWLTGLALAWLRVRRGVGTSMLMHGIFNGGPLLLIWLALQAGVDFVP